MKSYQKTISQYLVKVFGILSIVSIVSMSRLSFSQTLKTIDNTGGGDFASFTAAISYLNALDPLPENGIVFQVIAGQEFNEKPSLITKIANAASPVQFVKFGSGLNPVILDESSPVDDGVIHFSGASYISFSGIDIRDPNPGNSNRYVAAYYVNNSNNISIQNCKISDFSVYGIYCRNATHDVVINNNEVFHSDAYATTESSVYAIYANYNASANNIAVTNNKVYGFKNITSGVYGIRLNQINGTIANNFVSITGNGNDKLYAIRVDGREGKVQNVFHNSVYLEGTATDDGYALSVLGAAGTVNIKNNLLANMRDTATFDQLAVFVGFDGLTFNMDYNLYAGHDVYLGKWYQTYSEHILDWINASGVDQHSVEANPGYMDPFACDLHIVEANHGRFFLAGEAVEGFDTDIDGQNRDLTFPYKGADEGSVSMNLHANFSLDSVSFGQVIINELSDSVEFALLHESADILVVDSLVTNGPFLVKTGALDWDVFIAGFQLNGVGSTNFKVAYLPTGQTIQTGMVRGYLSNGQVLEIHLNGQGIVAGMMVHPDTLWFGQQLITEPGEAQTFYIKNTGETALNVASVETESGFSIRFGALGDWVLETPGFSIPVNDSARIDVRFNPDSVLNYRRFVRVHASMDVIIPVYGFGMGTRFELLQSGFTGAWYGKSALGDYDTDGDLDALVVSYGLAPGLGYSYFYKNNGNMAFEPVETGIVGAGNGMAIMVDLDNDGALDVFVSGQKMLEGNVSAKESKFYRNVDGNFIEKPCNILPMTSGEAIWGDVDNDGDYDIFIQGNTDVSHNYSLVYRNDGNFNFTLIQELDGIDSGKSSFADYDNDGDIDLSITGSRGSNDYVTLLYKNNNGVFEEVNAGLQGLRYSSLAWGDLDMDGDFDLVVTGSTQNELPSLTKIYRNDGNDVFTSVEGTMAGIRQGDMDIADLDQDGDLDIVMNGIYLNEASWIGHIYLNNGNMQFLLADSITSLKYANIVLADMDNDKDIDIFLTGRYDYQDYWCNIYENTFPDSGLNPEGIASSEVLVEGASAEISWTVANVDPFCTFNLDIENINTGIKLVSGMSHPDGSRMVPAGGNMGLCNTYSICYLPDGEYRAKIQRVNHSFLGSVFNDGLNFAINANNPPVVTGQISDTSMYAGQELIVSFEGVFEEPDTLDRLQFLIEMEDTSKSSSFAGLDEILQTIIFAPDSTQHGMYSFILKAFDRSGDSAFVQFDLIVKPPLSVYNILRQNFVVSPNPAQNRITLNTKSSGRLQIVNMLGVILDEKQLEVGLNVFVLKDLKPGVYNLIFTDRNRGFCLQKLVIQ